MLELVSVHIPKCGGTSLAALLEVRYGDRFHHWLTPPRQFYWPLVASYAKYLIDRIGKPSPRCVHGHFPASKYANKPVRMVVFVRDPAEIALSTYRFIHRRHAETGLIANENWESALAMSDGEFMARPRSVYARLADVAPERFFFVGSMNSFEDDIAALALLLGADDWKPQRLNSAATETEVPCDLRCAFRKANRAEYEIYNTLVARRELIFRQDLTQLR